MTLNLPGYVSTVMEKLNACGYECYVVGGAVRSALLHLPVHDYDLTTNALPEQTKEVFKGWRIIETGIQHGTVTVVSEHFPLEITTYRKDAEYKDHRHPDSVVFTSALQEDCARRDFTVNALCYHPEDGILDFYNGVEDLQNRIIRCIRNPEERFEEDALRILRALRFAARLHFSIEEKTSEALHACKDLLQYISAERLHEETNGLLIADCAGEILSRYRDVLEVYIPEFTAFSPELWKENAESLSKACADADVRMAILLHTLTEKDADVILQRLKYSNASRKTIRELIDMQKAELSDRTDLRHLLHDLSVPYEDYFSYRSALDHRSYEKEKAECASILEKGECITLKQLAVKGGDLGTLGIRGKEIAEILNHLLDEVMEERTDNRKESLLIRAAEIHEQIKVPA